MLKLSQELDKLIELQKIDFEIDSMIEEINGIPELIEQIKNSFEENKKSLTQCKNDLQKAQLAQHEKNTDLEQIEQTIKKHTTELNLIKSNQAYRALVDEIEESKKQKSAVEDEIINLLEGIDKLAKLFDDKQLELKSSEVKANQEIQRLQDSEKTLQKNLPDKKSFRSEHISGISKSILDSYEFLRSKKNKIAVVAVEGQGCGGCHMKLRVENLNQLYRLYSAESDSSEIVQAIVQCDNCSRILYLPEGLPNH